MAITKVEMWISVIALLLIVSFSIMAVGEDLLDRGITLDNQSIEYIEEFSNNVQENDFEDYSDNVSQTEKETSPVIDAVTNFPLVSNFLGAINWVVDKTKGVMSFISSAYNMPSFFLKGFGLDPGNWNHVTNILSAMLLVAFTIIMVRLAK